MALSLSQTRIGQAAGHTTNDAPYPQPGKQQNKVSGHLIFTMNRPHQPIRNIRICQPYKHNAHYRPNDNSENPFHTTLQNHISFDRPANDTPY